MSYRLLAEPRPIVELGSWDGNVQSFTHVVGYSGLGHVFMVDAGAGEHAVLYPLQKAWKGYGPFASTAEFAAQVLDDPGFAGYVLLPELQTELARRLGPLTGDEVYIPVPYPFLGGDGSLESYSKGDVWVFADIVGQAHGF